MATEGELDRRIQNLPQELQDEILDHVLFIEPGEVSVNTIDYKPPWQLQISRATRAKVAKHYYETSTFTIREKRTAHHVVMLRWFRFLTKEHQSKVADIRGDSRSDLSRPSKLISSNMPTLEEVARTNKDVQSWWARYYAKLYGGEMRRHYDLALGDGVYKSNYFYVVEAAGTNDAHVAEAWVSEHGLHA